MVKKLLISILMSVFLFGIGCKEKQTEEHQHDDQTKTISAERYEENKSSAVQLDDSKKWVANPETTQGIQAMITLADAYLANPTSDAKALKESIMSTFTGILRKCTMKGESHDQLHNYLLPLKEKLETLESSGDVQTVESIKSYLQTYKNYFE